MSTGHIRERESNKGKCYQIIVETEKDVETKERKRIYKTIYGNKKDAEKLLRELLSQIDNQIFIKNNDTTVKEFIAEWLKIYIEPYKSPTTTHYYKVQLERYVYSAIGNKKLQELKTIDIQKLYNNLLIKSTMSNKPLSPKTIRNVHMNIRAALDKAVQQELLLKNPAKNIELPKCSKYRADVYNKDEIKKLFELIKGTDLELTIHILIFLGLRRGELIALRWQNINFEKKTANIIENAVNIRNEIIIKDPKSESGKREISIPDGLMLMMKKAYTEYCLRKNRNNSLDDFVITQENGLPYKPTSITNKIKRFLRNNPELKRIRMHDLRHTSATLMLQAGISPKVAQKRLGHADFSTTMDIYSHVLEEMEQEAADKLDEIFSEKSDKKKYS
jgi:integrase